MKTEEGVLKASPSPLPLNVIISVFARFESRWFFFLLVLFLANLGVPIPRETPCGYLVCDLGTDGGGHHNIYQQAGGLIWLRRQDGAAN